jgi:hypothetical protein
MAVIVSTDGGNIRDNSNCLTWRPPTAATAVSHSILAELYVLHSRVYFLPSLMQLLDIVLIIKTSGFKK